MALTDSCHRRIDYLRVSVTDRCNLRCQYCMPENGVKWAERSEILKFEEIEKIVKAAVSIGIQKVRITGGEPLARRNLVELIDKLARIPNLNDLSLTTNGIALGEQAHLLKQAGLQRINVSIDSLKPDRFSRLTRGGNLNKVWQGLQAISETGFHSIKLNVVVLKDVNEDEILDFAALVKNYSWQVRFIELRPNNLFYSEAYLPIKRVWQVINSQYSLQEVPTPSSNTARVYKFQSAMGTLGFIGKSEECLCKTCNRLRLTATGRLYSCLFGRDFVDLRAILRNKSDKEELSESIQRAVAQKPAQLPAVSYPALLSPPMYEIGG